MRRVVYRQMIRFLAMIIGDTQPFCLLSTSSKNEIYYTITRLNYDTYHRTEHGKVNQIKPINLRLCLRPKIKEKYCSESRLVYTHRSTKF